MDSKTHRRGPADTSSGRFAKLILVSLLLHLPLTPWAALWGLLRFSPSSREDVSASPVTGIPIDLIEDQAPPTSASEQQTADPEGPGEVDPVLRKPVKRVPLPAKPADAGAPDAEPADAEPRDAESDAMSANGGVAQPDGGHEPVASDGGTLTDAGAVPDAGAKPISDPIVAGGVKRVADPDAHVRLMLYCDKIRSSPLGLRLGPLLASIYQWRDFLGTAGVDPIRDIDQIFIWGPQLRDSSNVGIILRHHLPAARMHAAIDRLVHADVSGGAWLDAGVPVASAHADNAERRFVLVNSETVVVAPPSLYAAALSAGKSLRLTASKGPEVAMLYLATPWRAFRGLPIQLPESIKWLRMRVEPAANGGAHAAIDAEDEDTAQAAAHALSLTSQANALAQLDLGFLGSLIGAGVTHRFVEHVSFSSDGKTIHGQIDVTAEQLSTALDMAGAFLSERGARRAPRPPSSSSGH